jgi:heavy metal efflux system protein
MLIGKKLRGTESMLLIGIGSATQKPFAIVIVTGLISRLFIGFFVNPVLYEMVAREGDVLQV